MNTVTEKDKQTAVHESPADEHRLRSERIAARGVSLGQGKAKFWIPLVGLAVLAGMAFASN
ncbi:MULTISPECIES: hypothetical protein [unclassified Duganella]|uniref:hypothetical protein n=1 Tax=unclassified Duganella TaxID=2636909 RepID=UPI000883B264|nr:MULTISPECIES: hypothetical protein [unclassified Duganella]SDF92066.1 hypothetical protein SAMN05216320_10222 [Duganella sp. OV458]SDJ12930.1 hypothetical protein SAMN05428973_102529 [Duganella sp. OV510]